jgi:membrane-associated protease RseP (regulator of RpoE activity)
MADPDDTLAIAYHESGHAVVARALGIKVTSLTIGMPPLPFGGLGWRPVAHCLWRI